MVNGKKEENTTAKVTEALAVVSQYCQKGDYASVQNLCHTLGYRLILGRLPFSASFSFSFSCLIIIVPSGIRPSACT